MADVDLVEKAVDTAILLVKTDGQRHRVASFMGNLLQIIAQFRCLFRSLRSKLATLAELHRIMSQVWFLTFAVLCSKQDGANLELLDNGPNVWGNCGPVEPHHEQLALYVTLLADPLCHPRVTSATYHGPAS